MNEFLEDVSSLYWWISVVVVGIIVGIISNYLPLIASKTGLKARDYWIRRSEEEKKKREESIRLLASNPEDFDLRNTMTVVRAIIAFYFLTMSTIIVLFAEVSEIKIDNYLLSALFTLLAVSFIRRIVKDIDVVFEAKDVLLERKYEYLSTKLKEETNTDNSENES